jgi:hypothetical protein
MLRSMIDREAAALLTEGTYLTPVACTYMAKLCLKVRQRMPLVHADARTTLQRHARVYAAMARHLARTPTTQEA